MHTETRDRLISRLLSPPTTFKRERNKEYLYQPYSPKLYRRVSLYQSLAYDLWVEIETDPSIDKYNELVQIQEFPREGGAIAYVRPSMVARNLAGDVTIHFITGDVETESTAAPLSNQSESETEAELLRQWSATLNFGFVVWTPKVLRANPILLENKKRLLRYICSPWLRLVPKSVNENVVAALKRYRTATVISLLESLPSTDEEELMIILAGQILSGSLYSDIDRYPLGYATQLSIHRECE